MDALDTLLKALGIPEYDEEGYSNKNYYEACPDDLTELLVKSMKDRPEVVFEYLLRRNQELERKVEKIDELESRLADYFSKLEMGESPCW